MERNILLTIEYDGTNFHGWQRQPELRTVQGTIEEALSRVCDMPISIDGVSRTDAGVHAWGQRATFGGDFGIPTDRIAVAVNNLLSEPTRESDVRIVSAEDVPVGFHARFDSKGKKYRYVIRNEKNMPVFLRNYRYQVKEELDLEAMKNAAAFIEGTHDFACFQAAGGTPRETTVRTVHRLKLTGSGLRQDSGDPGISGCQDAGSGAGDIIMEISGDGFLYNMVRIIAGTLVDVGTGRIKPEEINDILDGGDRRRAGHTAPPQGLYLVEVYY